MNKVLIGNREFVVVGKTANGYALKGPRGATAEARRSNIGVNVLYLEPGHRTRLPETWLSDAGGKLVTTGCPYMV